MKRGELWTVARGSNYAGKPRPVVIGQDDRFAATASITVCPFTSDPTDAPLLHPPVEPSSTNGLQATSRLMVDRITTVPKGKLGTRLGRLAADDVLRVDRAILMFLGLAG